MSPQADELTGGTFTVRPFFAWQCETCHRITSEPDRTDDGMAKCSDCGREELYSECVQEREVLHGKCNSCNATTPIVPEYRAGGNGSMPLYPCHGNCTNVLFVEYHSALLSPTEFFQLQSFPSDHSVNDEFHVTDHRNPDLDWLNQVGVLLSSRAKQVAAFKTVKRNQSNLWLLHDETLPVGYISWSKEEYGEKLSQMYLRPEYRGNRYGGEILKHWCETIVGDDEEYVVESPNKHMRALATRIGHVDDGDGTYTAKVISGGV